MLVTRQKRNTAKIVPAINAMFLSECCHSYLGKYILAQFGEKYNRNRTKCVNFCCKNVMQKTNNSSEVS